MKQILVFGGLFWGVLGFGQNNTYPYPQTGNIGFGTTTPTGKLDVRGKIVAGDFSVGGSVILEGQYGQNTPLGTLFSMGTMASSGNPYWGYGIKPKLSPSVFGYLSSTNLNIPRVGIELAGDLQAIKFLVGVRQSLLDGTPIALDNVVTISNEGSILVVKNKTDGTTTPLNILNANNNTILDCKVNSSGEGLLGVYRNGQITHQFYSGGNSFITNGNFGIGTNNPTAKLNIADGGQNMRLLTGTNSSGYQFDIGVNDDGINLSNNSSVRGYNFKNANGSLLTIQSSGNVGIGTGNTPLPADYKLSINGNAIAQKVVVKQNIFADYVFKSDYNLRPLNEVEQYIHQNGHLPNIPKEEEVKKNGLDLGDMNVKLLEKVEELTLYLIELKKENDDLKKRVQTLENKK